MKQTSVFQGQEVFQIEQGRDRIRIAPQYGARLLDWWSSGDEVIRWPEDADWSLLNKVRGGNPILFPFLARHYVDGVLGRWIDSGTVREMPMHGFARNEPFTVIESPSPSELVMRLEDTESTRQWYPYPFRFDVIYRLGNGSLEVEFITTNTGSTPLPYYAGHHFYLGVPHAARAEWTLTLPFAKTGKADPTGTIQFGPAPSSATLAEPALSDRFHIGPIQDQITLTNPSKGAEIAFELGGKNRIEADSSSDKTVPWYAVTTWTEKPDSDFYCVEPWLGLPNAIHSGLGLRWIEPGKTERAICTLRYRS